jgi:hypothetical protein
MTRIFTTLAAADALGLLAAFALGLLSFASGSVANPRDRTYEVHFLVGLFAILLNLGLHCLIFIYFLGTGRWVKEVALAYELPDEPWPRRTRDLKRATFPPALFAMLVPIAAAAAGQGSQIHRWPWQVHLALAVASLLVNAWAFRVEYRNVRTNMEVLAEVEQAVEHIRAERGLPSNAEALRQEG